METQERIADALERIANNLDEFVAIQKKQIEAMNATNSTDKIKEVMEMVQSQMRGGINGNK
jgi:flagellin-specific chaperone FliS